MDDETSTTRRNVLQGLVASGALTVGGVGLAAADHGGNGGNRGGGDRDHGQGGGQGGGGGNDERGPTGLTGGSGIMFVDHETIHYDEDAVDPETDDGIAEAKFELGTFTGNTAEYWTGCSAAGGTEKQQKFKEYPITWIDGPDAGTTQLLYIYQKKPVNPGTYNMVEAGECGYEGRPDVAKVGYEPAGEGHGDE